mmetsp:Transcript_12830/g.37398  ORF Transcript_12830/g.37398 Transcript_12830/m.37398 type:complete len:224 (-) Transcript_12830:482-1153(-)
MPPKTAQQTNLSRQNVPVRLVMSVAFKKHGSRLITPEVELGFPSRKRVASRSFRLSKSATSVLFTIALPLPEAGPAQDSTALGTEASNPVRTLCSAETRSSRPSRAFVSPLPHAARSTVEGNGMRAAMCQGPSVLTVEFAVMQSLLLLLLLTLMSSTSLGLPKGDPAVDAVAMLNLDCVLWLRGFSAAAARPGAGPRASWRLMRWPPLMIIGKCTFSPLCASS